MSYLKRGKVVQREMDARTCVMTWICDMKCPQQVNIKQNVKKSTSNTGS